MITLYNIPVSGNCHKIRLLLSFLEIDYQTYDLNLASLEQKSDEYLQLNPFGQAPVLVDGEITIRDSQAILVYLASHYGSADWWTDDPEQLAHITEWLSTAANEIAHGPALMRAHYKFGRKIDLEHTQTVIEKVLSIIDQHLHSSAWLVGSNPSIADIAIYPYLALAHEGHIDLNPYTHILEWMARFESLPHFIAMPGIQLNH
jgi:glutathione S-transferase